MHYVTVTDWTRLARAARVRRKALGLTQREVADRAGVNVMTIRNLEGLRTFARMPATIGKVETALGWAFGSAERIIAGGEPMLRDEPAATVPPAVDEPAFVRELRQWPGLSPALREELITAYLQSRRERLEAAEAAAERLVRRLADAASRRPDDEDDYPAESDAS